MTPISIVVGPQRLTGQDILLCIGMAGGAGFVACQQMDFDRHHVPPIADRSRIFDVTVGNAITRCGGAVDTVLELQVFDADGKGVRTDYRRMLRLVLGAGYNGWVGIEYEGSALPEPEGILATKRLLEKVCAEIAA